ncbi:PorT family protein [Empedobacter falsenii]
MKNLKTNLLSLFLLTFSTLSFAQMEYGVKVGGGISNTTVVHGISKERIGLLAGGIAKYQLTTRNENHYLQGELLYSNQGEFGVTSGGQKYKAFINYINIPVMYKYYFDDQGKDFFVEAGPQFSFKVSDNMEQVDENKGRQLKPNSFDFALNIGGGYAINRQYEINLRYQYGLTDTYDTDWENDTNRSSFLTLGLTYFFK